MPVSLAFLHVACDDRSKVVDAGMIDKMNILRAALDAMAGAADALPGDPVDFLLVDGPYLPQASSLPSAWSAPLAQASILSHGQLAMCRYMWLQFMSRLVASCHKGATFLVQVIRNSRSSQAFSSATEW